MADTENTGWVDRAVIILRKTGAGGVGVGAGGVVGDGLCFETLETLKTLKSLETLVSILV
jgi:hypothetical protein